MPREPEPITGQNEGVAFQLKPEFLAGDYWWRVWVGGHPKVLVRHQENAEQVAHLLAHDEAQVLGERRGPPPTSERRERRSWRGD